MSGPQDAGLVPGPIGEDHPADVGALSHVHSAGSELLEPARFGILIGWAQVEV